MSQPAVIVDFPPPSESPKSQYQSPKEAKKNTGWLNSTAVAVIIAMVIVGLFGYYLSQMQPAALEATAKLIKEEFVDTDTGLRLKALHFDNVFGSERAKAIAFTACPIEGCSPAVPIDQLITAYTLSTENALANAHISRHLFFGKAVIKERGLIAYGLVEKEPLDRYAEANFPAAIEAILHDNVQSLEQVGFATFYLTKRAQFGCYYMLLVSENEDDLAKFDFMKKAA